MMSCSPSQWMFQWISLEGLINYVFIFYGMASEQESTLKKLQQRVGQEGLGIPNLLLYHYAFCLRHLAQWYLPPERALPWFTAEAHYCRDLPLAAYLSASLPPAAQDHPVLSCLRGVWRKTAKILNFDPFLNTSSSIWYNPSLRIGKSSFYWKEWANNGIWTLGNLFKGKNLKSFRDR